METEDTQHLKEVLSQLELIAYEVWLDHTTSGKNLYKKFKVNDMKTAIEAARKLIQDDTTLYSQEVIDSYQEELASLRDQLKYQSLFNDTLNDKLTEAKKLIMDIHASWQQLNELTPELEERISRLLLTSAK